MVWHVRWSKTDLRLTRQWKTHVQLAASCVWDLFNSMPATKLSGRRTNFLRDWSNRLLNPYGCSGRRQLSRTHDGVAFLDDPTKIAAVRTKLTKVSGRRFVHWMRRRPATLAVEIGRRARGGAATARQSVKVEQLKGRAVIVVESLSWKWRYNLL